MRKESTILVGIMLAASKLGHRLFRNTTGSYNHEGRWIRYGLANPGGSDLIGWTEVTVTHGMIGKKVAIFTAVEGKTQTMRATKEQQNFIDNVKAAGGIALVARDVADYEHALRMRPR